MALIRESYRLNEGFFQRGLDIVVVARVQVKGRSYQDVERALLHLGNLHHIIIGRKEWKSYWSSWSAVIRNISLPWKPANVRISPAVPGTGSRLSRSMGRLRGFCWPCGGSCDVILFQKVGTTQCLKCVRACLKDHPCHLYVPLCAGSVPHSASAVRCASFMCFIFSTDPPQIVMCSRHKNF